MKVNLPPIIDLEYATTQTWSKRKRIRYIAALWPDANERELPNKIFHALGKQVRESDIRMILQARRLNNPTSFLNELPIATIQSIGRMLFAGYKRQTVWKKLDIDRDAVLSIDRYLNITEMARQNRLEYVKEHVKGTPSARQIAKELGVSRYAAKVLIEEALLTKETASEQDTNSTSEENQ